MAVASGAANPEMTFGDEIQDPKPKRRRKAGKAGKAGTADDEEAGTSTAGIAEASQPSSSGLAAGNELADSEPAELTRTGAADVVADADKTVPRSTGDVWSSTPELIAEAANPFSDPPVLLVLDVLNI